MKNLKETGLLVIFVGIMIFALCNLTKPQKHWLDEMSVADGSKKLIELGYQKPDQTMNDSAHVQWAKAMSISFVQRD